MDHPTFSMLITMGVLALATAAALGLLSWLSREPKPKRLVFSRLEAAIGSFPDHPLYRQPVPPRFVKTKPRSAGGPSFLWIDDIPEIDYDPMYMGGRGTMERTRELNAALWSKVETAMLGAVMVAAGVLIIGACYIFVPPSPVIMIGVAAAFGLILHGVRLHMIWERALRDVKRHTAAMQAETAKRGAGWASS